jgi:hypothetical protein
MNLLLVGCGNCPHANHATSRWTTNRTAMFPLIASCMNSHSRSILLVLKYANTLCSTIARLYHSRLRPVEFGIDTTAKGLQCFRTRGPFFQLVHLTNHGIGIFPGILCQFPSHHLVMLLDACLPLAHSHLRSKNILRGGVLDLGAENLGALVRGHYLHDGLNLFQGGDS